MRPTRLVLVVAVALLATACTGSGWGVGLPGAGGSGPSTPAVTGGPVLDVAAGAAHSCELRADRSV